MERRGTHSTARSMETLTTLRGGITANPGVERIAQRAVFRLGKRLNEEACAGKPQAGFCEGEAHNDARLNLVALSKPKGERNREYKASLNIGGVLPTRQAF